MNAPAASGMPPGSLRRFLQQELSVFPGRYNAMLRYLLSSVIVIVISMALNVPQLSYSLLVIFFATQHNIVLTRMIFPLFILVNTAAVGCAILILKFTIDYPMLRLLSAAITLLLLLYLMRSSKKWGFLYFGVAITVTYAQSFVDLSSNGEMLVRNCLWTWVAGCYATVVAHIVNTLFLPVEPVRQLKQEMERILTVVSRALDATAAGKPVATIGLEEIQNSVLTLHKFLKFSVMRDAGYRENEGTHLAEIATAERLYSATRNLHRLAAARLPAQVADHCHLLAQECRALLQSIQHDEAYRLRLQQREQIKALPDCLQEMYSALFSISLLAEHEQQPAASGGPVPAPANPKSGIAYDYIKYGIKTLFSVALCYIFYTSVKWPGIHTSMLTCIIVALPGLGASVQKSLLRIGGCLVGSALALFCTVFILPHIDSITGLLLMVTPVIALSSWVAAGSERSSYAGIQILFAFSLAMFTHFGPSPDLLEIRDRLIGILLGIIVATLIHSLIWPETEGKTLRQSLAGLFVYFAEKMSPIMLDKHARANGWAKLDATQTLLAQVALEPNWRSNDNEQLTLTCQTLLGKLRELHVALYRLEIEYALAAEDAQQSALLAPIERIMQRLAAGMKAYGEGLQQDPVISARVCGSLGQELEAASAGVAVAGNTPLLLSAQEVITICSSIPAWPEDGEVILSRVRSS
ncbi:multidrug efflux system protein MdtO [Serratia ficaria]|uniref:FUSC family protein n=1 Tax=Serratia ficaria TaxID=61651 RepID=UPI00217A36D6|nr:FUSC family protein [Serratia ficaria]CAI2151340.1 multidrug efflux system protein MdtO [Serratia ficaria]CAI2483891.1 multidrug efflux system protein MdtO [Serratia ficaria]